MQHPEDARARAQLGLALLELGDIGGAEIELAKARDLGADRKDTLVAECRLLVTRSAYERVLEECNDVGDPAIDPDLAIARGDALLGLQRFTEARTNFEFAAKARPTSLSAIHGLAAAAFGLEGPAGARKVFEAAPQAVKDQPRYWLALGSEEIRGGDFAAAERAFATAVEKTGKEENARPHVGAGRAGRGTAATGQDERGGGDGRSAAQGGTEEPVRQGPARPGRGGCRRPGDVPARCSKRP